MGNFIRFFFLVFLVSLVSILPIGAQSSLQSSLEIAASAVPLGEEVSALRETSSVRPPVETAMIDGVLPGVTTIEQLTGIWGEPQSEKINGDQIDRLYSREPLNHITVTARGGIVRRIIIQFDTPFPEGDVRSSLQDELLKSKPVLIPDESEGYMGEVFPERGVMFSFAPQTASMELLVERIVIEPISADPFVIRAEAILYDQPTEARRDLADAIRLKPEHAKAYWILAQIELLLGNVETALQYNEKAIQFDQQKPAYHLTFVQAMIQMNRIEEAKQYLHETIEICDRFPHEKARALMMLGELYRICRHPDYKLASQYQSDAIQLATLLLDHKNSTVRLAAKDVMVLAHIETARTVARGPWENKKEAIAKWIEQATLLSKEAELVRNLRYSREYPFKIASCSLATLVAMPDISNIDLCIEDVVEAGNELISTTSDPILKAKYHWDTSIALYDAVQIFQLHKQYSSALKYGELAVHYMEIGIKPRKSETDQFLQGRLYYRLGALHAIGNENHRAAIEWYDLAKPIYEQLLPKIDSGALELFGEALVSMGVSYWSAGQREEAIRLTERGRLQIERGVRDKVIPESKRRISYSNLAVMYRELGDQENMLKYEKLIASVGSSESSPIR